MAKLPKGAKNPTTKNDGQTVTWEKGGKLYSAEDPDLWEKIHSHIETALKRIFRHMHSDNPTVSLKACEMWLNFAGLRMTAKSEQVTKTFNIKTSMEELREAADKYHDQFNERHSIYDLPLEIREKIGVGQSTGSSRLPALHKSRRKD